jgi:hypothetical protein
LAGAAQTASNSGEFVLTGLTKAEAKVVAQGMGLPNAQFTSVNSALSRATSSSKATVVQYGPDVVVQILRPGRQGYQVMESIVTPNGTKTVVQKAYDAAGKLDHYDPKR